MAPANEPKILLRHGTTRRRAENIIKNGPDPHFLEPGGLDEAVGLSVTPISGPYPQGSAEKYAVGKARVFPTEGGPAIVEIEVPVSVAARAVNVGGEIRFLPGYGLEELLSVWVTLPKRIVSL